MSQNNIMKEGHSSQMLVALCQSSFAHCNTHTQSKRARVMRYKYSLSSYGRIVYTVNKHIKVSTYKPCDWKIICKTKLKQMMKMKHHKKKKILCN